ncbi:MarR family winged helix-turn-helix transcriptional regulator [Solimonas terrae]|uniref:MarR family transcriptional regulator n=1 Tax=Solimonas terrae TaxID=1396819 RepID=A0A6M2BS66_9GAMM|nr:MarR family transcriptional regulator [Solimonas terrae]NGY04943.1 MarR family transcriptional regulator [Solimonas terrae]
MKTPPPPTTTSSLLMEVGRLLRADFGRRAEHLKLTQAQMSALARLSKQPGISQVALAEMLEVHPVTVTQLIDRLQRAGWVRREVHEDDRRAFRLFLTDKADPILSEVWKIAAQAREHALSGLSKAERDQLDSLLTRMKLNLAGDCSSGRG